MSRLRAKCPDCKTFTAVALGPEYQCHACGREFAAGLVRVPRAWGKDGDAMAEAASLALPFPEAAVVEEASLGEQTLALASELPERPLVLGGCCCAHTGAVEGLAARHDRLAVVWIDAHGDLNTADSSPTGNEWGMPLRKAIDSGAVAAEDVALVGARKLDQPERDFISSSGLHVGKHAVPRALEGADAVYIAFDGDALDPGEIACFMPERGGLKVADAEDVLREVRGRNEIVGAGLTGLLADPANLEPLARITAALWL